MILCIDAGNTRVKFGLHDGLNWVWREALPCLELGERLDALINALPCAAPRILGCNVAGARVGQELERLGARTGVEIEWLKSACGGFGVVNGYTSPEQLGNDRWAALIGAHHICPAACVVVMAGTATTIDTLDETGRFIGGMILPGLRLMRTALANDTAQLPLACGRFEPWPRNTDDAIVSGCIAATAGAIAWVRAQHMKLPGSCIPKANPASIPGIGYGAVPCVLSGGAAHELQELLDAPLIIQPDLVLEGLVRSARGNSKENG